MKNGKYSKRGGVATKAMVMILAVMLIVGCTIGGTLAWLSTKTAPVVNTFTFGDIDITLAETTSDFKMVPGNTIAKDPKVTVLADSEDCWLFVKVEESTNLGNFISYSIDSGWTPLTDVDGVYYREVPASTSAQEFDVLTSNQVTVLDNVTKEMLNASGYTDPTLTFTAYAVQKDNVATAAAAWEIANPS